MAFSKITTRGMSGDTLEAGDIAPNAIGASELANNAVDTAAIADDAVTGAKIENNPTVAGNLTVAGTSTLTGNATASGKLTVAGDFVPSSAWGHRNLIINGDFKVWQRSAATTMETVANNWWKADRWKLNSDIQAADLTCGRSDDVPAGQGFTNSMKVVPGGADTNQASGHIATIVQYVESQNLRQLCYGTSSAKSVTLSFWVKTNMTGLHSVCLVKHQHTSYACPIEYTVSSANTWEKKEITFSPTAGSTSLITSSAGAINNNNGKGFAVCWNLAAGSTYRGTNNTWQSGPATGYGLGTGTIQNFVGSTSNNFYLTGVQLEVGSTATPFEHKTYQTELVECMRYCQIYQNYELDTTNNTMASGWAASSTAARVIQPFFVPFRIVPALTCPMSISNIGFSDGATATVTPSTFVVNNYITHLMMDCTSTRSGGGTNWNSYRPYYVLLNNPAGMNGNKLIFHAEL